MMDIWDDISIKEEPDDYLIDVEILEPEEATNTTKSAKDTNQGNNSLVKLQSEDDSHNYNITTIADPKIQNKIRKKKICSLKVKNSQHIVSNNVADAIKQNHSTNNDICNNKSLISNKTMIINKNERINEMLLKNKSLLKRHMIVHPNVRSLKCLFCEKTFRC